MTSTITNQNNPYIIGRPIYEPEYFFGREDLFSFIQDNLNQKAKVILLHGQRRIGKSSVLAHIPNFVKLHNFVFVNLSLEGKSQKSLNDVLYELSVDIVEYLEDEYQLSIEQITIPSKQAFKGSQEIFTEEFLPQVYKLIDNKNLVLLLDEFDVLSESSQDVAAEHFFPYLQSIINTQDNLYIIPVIGRQLEDLPNLLKVFHQAPNKKIGLLQKENAIKLIANPAKDILMYEDDAINKILELSAGHPYFTQVICFALFSQAREEEKEIVTVSDVENIIERAIEIGEAGLIWFRDGLSVTERVFISAVAEIQKQQSKSNTKDPLKFLVNKDVFITKPLQEAEKKLVEGEFLTKSDKNTYCISINLVILWLTYRYNLTQAIEEFEKLYEQILILDLSSNSLIEIPESITKLTNLTQLDLSSNSLTEIPESITKLTNLTQLDLSSNSLTEIPESITKLTNLTQLYLNSNSLIEIPENITKLTNLTQLYLNSNSLTEIPESIMKLTNLTQLDLSSNSLIEIPGSITKLTNLTQLYLSSNNLTEIPESITKLTNLITLDLDNNEIEIPPLEIVAQGIKSIRDYFLQLEVGQDYIYEAKLIIVGEGGAGKTTLAKKIDNPDYQLQQDEPTTEGIDVITWKFYLPEKEREFQVNIWDFGGQEIYHATHQFFLTKRSLYALVADTRKEDTDFYYWLNVVELLTDNSPILIIKNEKQDRHREININALRGQFSSLKETLAINLKTNRGLPEVITNIQDYIKKLPHIGQVLPKTWVNVRETLEKDPRNYISLYEYLDICEVNGFTTLSDKLQLSGYLHDLGVCLHFQDKEDSILYKTIILKPKWGTDAVYKVLDSKQVINNQGCFTRDDLKNIWYEGQYASMTAELLELMSKFQLCYEIPNRKDTFISPQLLSENQPAYNWNESKNLILRYAYPDFMPKGIISRFIVTMHQYIDQQNYVWKSGVILNQDNTKAEVIEYYGKREIKVRVVGSNKQSLMTIITNELDKINNSYKRLKYQKLIPCNCNVCQSNPNPHFYNFETLKKFLEHRQKKIQCQESFEMVNVLGLMDDVIMRNKQDQDNNVPQFAHYHAIALSNKLNSGNNKADYHNTNKYQAGYINNSHHVNISGNAQVDSSGAGAFNLGDISGTVANTINQLPNFDNEPDKQELKKLLNQLKNAVLEENLDEEETEEALKQIQAIASSLTNSQDAAAKKTAKKAMKILRVTVLDLPPDAAMVTICNQLRNLISKIF